MMLVDNFKVILLVVLICAAGLQSTEALKCKQGYDRQTMCKSGRNETKCMAGAGPEGCATPEQCPENTASRYCCEEDDCNDMYDAKKKDVICAIMTKGCEELKKIIESYCKEISENRKKIPEECKDHKGAERVQACKDRKEQRYKAEMENCKNVKKAYGMDSGAAGTYGGISIPIVTLVSAFLYYIPLNFFL